MIDSLKIADFFFTRIQQTIAYKQYIQAVNIEYMYDESYGNEYVRISYTLEVHKSFQQLSFNEQEFVFEGSPNCIFSLSTHTTNRRWDNRNKLLSLIEFRQIYESLTAYAILQLEQGLEPGTPIKVQGIDLWPWANYAEKYLLAVLQKKHRDFKLDNYESDVRQWSRLHQLAKQSRKINSKKRNCFSVTDTMLCDRFSMDLTDVRSILLNYQVPIRVKGIKTIDEVQIHTVRLVEALKKKINMDDYWNSQSKWLYQRLVIYLYNHYLLSEKEDIIRQQQIVFLNNFMVQQGDVVELTDKRIVMVNSVTFEKENAIYFEYTIIKNNLQLSTRTRTISIDNAVYVLKGNEFMYYLNSTYIKNLSRLSRWMGKKRIKIVLPAFEPDLLSEKLTGEP